MRLGYLSSSVIPSSMANSIQVMEMCAAFTKIGHRVTLFARRPARNQESDFSYYGIDPIFQIEKNNWPDIRGIGGIHFAMQVKKTVCAARGEHELLYGRDIYSLLLCSSLGIPVIYEAHTPPANPFRQFLEKRLLTNRNFLKLVVISGALKQEYLRRFREFPQNKILVAHDGARMPDWKVKNKIPLGEGKRNVGYVGQLYPGKGMEIIVNLAKALPEVKFHIIGGSEENIEHWKRRGQTRNILFYGHVPHGRIPRYLQAFDLMLAPYQYRVQAAGGGGDISKWMSPLKIFEYMSYGKAIVASDLPVIREVLVDGDNSLLCGPDRVEEWVEAITLLIENPSLRRSLGNKAFEDYERAYTWQKRGEKVLG